jgi:hypothetical protein
MMSDHQHVQLIHVEGKVLVALSCSHSYIAFLCCMFILSCNMLLTIL